MSALLTHLRTSRRTLDDERKSVIASVEARGATVLTEDETSRVTAIRTQVDALDARIAELEDAEQQDARAAATRAQLGLGVTGNSTQYRASWSVTGEPGVYTGENGSPSFVRDLTAVAIRGYDPAAQERLARHQAGMATEKRALNTTDGTGGEFAPPMWMVDKYIALARAGRVTCDRMTRQLLPAGVDSFNIPKIATGSTVAEQTSQNTAISNTDATTTSVPLNIATLAGQQVMSVQSIEQSPINFDQVLLQDLAADYTVKLDAMVISNNATGKVGLLSTSGINGITYTDASPTGGELYPKLADAIQRIATARFLGADAIVMHPRRWAWLLSQLDSNGRPYVVPAVNGPLNALASMQDGAPAQGYVGEIQGLPVYVDPNVPTNLGAGTNEDRILIGRWSDGFLFESTPRLEVFRETKADQLSVLLRFYNYAAFTFGRYAAAFSVVSGTGLVAPTF